MITTNEDVEMEDAETEKILANTSDEVTAARIQTVYTTERIKANTNLIKKLSKEREHSEEVYRIISNDNNKLKFEIAQSQKVIKCMLTALETVKTANLDLEKEYLLAKQKKKDVIERAQNGEKKYEDLWLECKARYEGLPHMKNLLNAKDEVKNLEHKIAELENNEKILRTEIKAKTKSSFNTDRERIVQLADFMTNQMPKNIHLIVEKSAAIKKLKKELEKLEAKAITNIDNEKPTKEAKEKGVDCVTSDGPLKLRKLMLSSLDFGDVLSVKHDKNLIDSTNKMSNETQMTKHSEFETYTMSKGLEDDEFSMHFIEPSFNDYKPKNYARKKLINILEDIKIDKNSALTMMNRANLESLYPVSSISIQDKNAPNETLKDHQSAEELEDTVMTASNAEMLLMPPTQFLDVTTVLVSDKQKEEEIVPPLRSPPKEIQSSSQTLKNSQEGYYRKKVSFDLPNKFSNNEIDVEKPEKLEKISANETFESQINVSADRDDQFSKMKEILMKKHNLDSSPQFVFSKNTMTSRNLQKSEDAIVTSKFFHQEQNSSQADPAVVEKNISDIKNTTIINELADAAKTTTTPSHINIDSRKSVIEMDVDYPNVIPNPIMQNINKKNQSTASKTVSGYESILSHGTKFMTESLDSSITMGYDDVEAGLQHCIDSNLLLSPKADFTQGSEKPEKLSENLPSFMSGMRKAGLSFFGSETKTDSSAQNQGGSGFNFNFGGGEKKTRGGLFNLFQ